MTALLTESNHSKQALQEECYTQNLCNKSAINKRKIKNQNYKHQSQSIGKKHLIFFFITTITTSFNVSGEMEISNTYQLIHDHLSKIHSVDKYKNAMNARNQKQELPDIILSPGERRSILLQNFSQAHKANNETLSYHAVKDLHILSGTIQNPGQSLLSSIGSPMTVTGEIMLANLLISPITDVNTLQKRQQALQYLLDHPKVIFQIEEYLIHYAADEDGLIALLDPSDVVNSPHFDEIDYQTHFPGLTSDSTREEIARRLNDTINILGALNVPLGLIGSTFLGIFDPRYGIVQGLLDAAINLPSNMNLVISIIHQNFQGLPPPAKIFTLGSFVVLQIIAIYKSYRLVQETRAAYTFVMERSRRPGRALESARELKQLLQYHPVLEGILNHYSGFLKFRNSTQIQEIVTLLKDAPEKTPDALSYLSTNMGRYKRSLMLLRRNHSSLTRIMQATGEIDAWLTVAKLLRSSSYREHNPLSFAQYELSEQPTIELQGFWNPLLHPSIAIPSDLTASQSPPSNIIITGPNAAGKSTAIDAIALNVIMAQTLGIAAAEALALTPFSFIHTHMVIEPETFTGVSSFSAESKRAIKLLQKLQSLTEGQFSIAFLDEIFSNTNPKEGEVGALAYMKAIGDFSNTISISSTHYTRLTSLADQFPGTFQNIHVSADINNEGNLEYDYVLKPGSSTQNVAFNILKEGGIQQDFLDIVQELLEDPEGNTPKASYNFLEHQ
ncbi:hypothetical protein GV64_21560 [Endozoicomonas elysicola]|uniref:DNA mismatch repair proteins mutS family domain-containing protein n=2 Tax=Endozoicomonas elysicola TaxID=305900 RepID=A0A081KFN6_9GAMM|nr:hypothetical protein GV64_21560 [Endozoicomonas elysicola]